MEHLYYILLNLTKQEWLCAAILALALLVMVKLPLCKNEIVLKARAMSIALMQSALFCFFALSVIMWIFLCEKPNESYKRATNGHYSQAFYEHIEKIASLDTSTFGFRICNISSFQGKKCENYMNYLEAQALRLEWQMLD